MTGNNSESRSGNKNLLIEHSLPVRTIGIECEREGKGTFPPLNRLHIWWARRPLIAARSAVLSSVISEDNMEMTELVERMGITGDTVEKHKTVDDRPSGKLVYEHYGYRRPFTQKTSEEDLNAIQSAIRQTWDGNLPKILDVTAGGGAIPFESRRYGLPTIANELNPVASLLLRASLAQPVVNGDLSSDIRKWGERINEIASEELEEYYPSKANQESTGYLWAHTVDCPDCGLEVPLSPNWWVKKESSREGIAARPSVEDGTVEFSVVELSEDERKQERNSDILSKDNFDPTNGSVSYGKGECLNCGVTIDGDEIKGQAQEEGLGYQLFCVEYTDLRTDETKFRSPEQTDLIGAEKAREKVNSDPDLSTLLSEERYIGPADRAANYGITEWRDAFTPRQLLTHYTYLQAFEEVKPDIRSEYDEESAQVLLTFLAITADKTIDYNSRFSSWHNGRALIRNTFDRHDFSFKWSFAEALPTVFNYEWALGSVVDVYEELEEYLGHLTDNSDLEILNQNAAQLSVDSNSVEAVVMDPPYYDNVMYAELSDYFYVWMKRYLKDVHPDLFSSELTHKHEEAVANVAEFEGMAGENQSKSELAKNDYERKMSDILDEVNRVLRDDGVLTLMFTHKKTEAWDTLTKALINAGFTIHTSHPINTESPRSLHQTGKNAARSTIFLTARKRDATQTTPSLWDDIQSKTRNVAFERAKSLDAQEVEFAKVDMILSAFGPTLEVFTQNFPVVNSEGEEVSPQVALDEARGAVRDYLVGQYLNDGVRNVDSKTEWYILAWLVFEAQRFPYDEARRLAIGVGEDLDSLKKTNRMWRKRSGDVLLRPHEDRVQDVNKDRDNRSNRKPVDPDALSFSTSLDKVHAAMHIYEVKGATETWNWMNDRNCDSDPAFKATLEALLRVLPHNHSDWELGRDLAAGETGELLDLDLDSDIFREGEGVEVHQGSLKDF